MDYKNFSGSPQPTQPNNGIQYKEMFPRIKQDKRQLTPDEQSQNKLHGNHPKGPGIFFDMQKGMQYQKIETTKKILQRASSQNQVGSNVHQQTIEATATAAATSAGGFVHLGDKNQQKLYSPYEYLHYATKINFSKESYLSALSQLGYTNVNNLNAKPYNDIMNKTQGIIAKSYSLKYLGVIDGNMGILSKRVKIGEGVRESSQGHPQQGKTRKQRKNIKKKDNENSVPANISVVPQSYRPDLYNSYMITSYSLPKYLKPIIKEKDVQIVEEKQRLEKWHIDQLKKNSNFFTNENLGNEDTTQQQSGINMSVSMSMNAGINNYIGKIKPKKLISINRQPSPNTKNDSLNKFYAEVPEESMCYAIIDKQNEVPINQSYSRQINTISKPNIEQQNHQIEDLQIIPQVLKTTKSNFNASELFPQQQQFTQHQSSQNIKCSTIYSSNQSIKFTQNQQLQNRFDHIAKYLNEKKKK